MLQSSTEQDRHCSKDHHLFTPPPLMNPSNLQLTFRRPTIPSGFRPLISSIQSQPQAGPARRFKRLSSYLRTWPSGSRARRARAGTSRVRSEMRLGCCLLVSWAWQRNCGAAPWLGILYSVRCIVSSDHIVDDRRSMGGVAMEPRYCMLYVLRTVRDNGRAVPAGHRVFKWRYCI
jgi:hypothetical protein